MLIAPLPTNWGMEKRKCDLYTMQSISAIKMQLCLWSKMGTTGNNYINNYIKQVSHERDTYNAVMWSGLKIEAKLFWEQGDQ